MALAEVEEFARGMYSRVGALWAAHRHELSTGECGYSLISGPPQYRPALMIIGENPGFAADDKGLTAPIEISWPQESHLPTANWKLARKIRDIFADAGLRKLHDDAIMTNFLFFKSGSVAKREPRSWIDNDPALRKELERVCFRELAEFIRLSEPRNILVLGIGAFERFADRGQAATKEKDIKGTRRLIVTGHLLDLPAIGIMHPTGNRIDARDVGKLSRWLACYFREQVMSDMIFRAGTSTAFAGN